MARCSFAKWDVISGSPGRFTGGPLKVVTHKTQGSTLEGARRAYRSNRSDPHFTVHADGINQHIDTAFAARSLRNASGGVQTNFDGAIQLEIVGWSGTTAGDRTLANLVHLYQWLRDFHRIPWLWPEGRPPTNSATGYGLNNGERHPSTWDHTGGHYGHSQVPENTHWDPAFTDVEWNYLNAHMQERQPVAEQIDRVGHPPVAILMHPTWPEDSYAVVTADGGVFNYGGSPFYGSHGGQPLNKPVVAVTVTPSGRGYTMLCADGGILNFGDADYRGRVSFG